LYDLMRHSGMSYPTVINYGYNNTILYSKLQMPERSNCNVLLPEDLDYMASVIDRNGTISIVTNYTTGKHQGSIRIKLHEKDEAEKIRKLLGTGSVYKNTVVKKYITHSKTYTYYRIGLGTYAAYELLLQLKDRLNIQYYKADLYIQFVEIVQELPKGVRRPMECLPDEAKRLYDLLRNCNDRKGKPTRNIVVNSLL